MFRAFYLQVKKMKPIAVNELGSISISEELIEKMVFSEMLKSDNDLIPCKKSGVLLTKNEMNKSKDSSGSVQISFNEDYLIIEINYVAIFGKSIKKTAEKLFKDIINVFDLIGIGPDIKISANIKGVMSGKIAERDIKLLWTDEKVEVV